MKKLKRLKTCAGLVLIYLALFNTVAAQEFKGKLENHTKGDMDIVLTMFGLDKLVKIGTVSANGDFKIDLSHNPEKLLTAEEAEVFISQLSYGFQFTCGNPDDFPEGEPKIATNAGYIALWQNNTWAGSLFPVSNKQLQLWMDDNGYNDAVEGSFFKVLLVTEAVKLQKKCSNFDYYDDKDIEVAVEFDLNLTEGLNLIQYKVETVYKTDPNIRASFPTKIKMTNTGENPDIIWVAKYFY